MNNMYINIGVNNSSEKGTEKTLRLLALKDKWKQAERETHCHELFLIIKVS